MLTTVLEPDFIAELAANLEHKHPFIQVILGPRQVGKTTGILGFLEKWRSPHYYVSADDELAPTQAWVRAQWQQALLLGSDTLLVIDEIQKVPDWSQIIKGLWDEQKRKKARVQLVLLGSSSLQLQQGLHESLAGRFQLVPATHWGYFKSRALRSMSVHEFVEYGGYPGSYALLKAPAAWRRYVTTSIVDAVIGKDILNIVSVQKPALFRQAFSILMSYPAQEISYTKLLGQLQDSGNTDLIRRYIELYEGAFIVKTISKYAGKAVLSRTSSPKLIPLCGALINRDVFLHNDGYGRAFEAAVGAALVNAGLDPSYWRDGNAEVDYIVTHDNVLYAIEVKSGRTRSRKGLDAFCAAYPRARQVFVTPENIEIFWANPRQFLETLR